MQCVSCQFENIPGVATCGRCGSTLRLATAVLDVHPPRATPMQKRMRRLFGRWGTPTGWRAALEAARPVTTAYRLTLPSWGVLARLFVPGLAYFYLGDYFLGRIVVAVYLALLLPGILFFGTYFGSLLLGLAVCVHASSSAAIFLRHVTSVPARVLTALAVLVGLSLCVYGPPLWLLTQLAQPIAVQADEGLLKRGDVLLCNQLAYRFSQPAPGAVVLYHSGGLRIEPGNGAGPYPMVVAAGDQIDCILAGPGASVAWQDGQLRVNGTLSEVRPLRPAMLPKAFSVQVPSDCWLIFPSNLPNIDTRMSATLWQRLWLVPTREIRGNVYLRTQPLSRFGRLQ